MIAATVVLYNPSKDELKNIQSYIDCVDMLYIMDNSKSSNLHYIEQDYNEKNYKYFHFPDNIGLCSALNKSMQYAKKDSFKWMVVFDSDSSLITDIISVYKKHMNDFSNVAVFAPVHIFDRSSNEKFEGTREIKWSMTSGCMFNIEIFLKIGGFMEELFVDGLDIDYCYRAKENGYKIIQCGEALLNHHPGETKSVKIFGKPIFKYGYASPIRIYYQARSCIWCFLMYKEKDDLFRYFWKWFKVLFLFDNKFEYLKEIKIGTLEGIELYKKQRIKLKNGED